MKLRTQGQHLAKLLGRTIPVPLIVAAMTFQTSLLLFAAIVAAVLGAFMWLIGLSPQIAFALAVLCLGAWAATPLFVELLLGMSASQEMAVAHYVVSTLIAMGVGLLVACALVWSLGDLLPRFYLAAAVTGLAAPALLLGWSMWYCRGRPELQQAKE